MGPNQNMHIVKAGRDCLAQQTDKWREFTKPGYDGVSSVYILGRKVDPPCSIKDVWTTRHV